MILARIVFAAFEALDATLYRFLALVAARRPAPGGREPEGIHFLLGSLGLGGAQRQLVELVRFLVARGHGCKVWVLESEDYFRDEVVRAGATVEYVFRPSALPNAWTARLSRALRNRSHAWVALQLATHLRRERPSVLQCFLNTTNVAGALAGRLARVPVVALGLRSLHPLATLPPGAPGFHRLCYRLLHSDLVDVVVANSAAGLASFLHHEARFPTKKLQVIRNGLSLDTPSAPQSQTAGPLTALGLPRDLPLILWAGRFAPEKRVEVLLQALARVAASGRPFAALLAGEGPTSDHAKALSVALGLGDRVRFLGPRRDVPELLRLARVAVLTSEIEGLSNYVLEAHLAGCPVVATRAGGTPEIVDHGVTGLLSPPGDVEAIATNIARILDDPGLAARLGQAGAERAQGSFTPDRMGQETLALYEGLFRAKRRGSAPGGLSPERVARGLWRRLRVPLDAFLLVCLAAGALACRKLLPRAPPATWRDDRLHLAIFIPQLGLGGAQRALATLLEQVDPGRYRVELLALATRGDFFGASAAHVSLVTTFLPGSEATPLWLTTCRLWRLLRRTRPDVVVGWMHWATSVSVLAGSLARVPRVLAYHQSLSPDRRRIRPVRSSRALDTLAGVLADGVLACSAAAAASHARWGRIRAGKLTVIPNASAVLRSPVQVEERFIGRERLGIGAPCVIGLVGRLANDKRPDLFLQTVSAVAREVPEVLGLVVGDGPLRDELLELSRTLHIERRVAFLGARTDARDCIAALDVLLLTSEVEGLPLVLLEAQAAGVPVVTTAAGGAPEAVVDGSTGFVVPVDDIGALTDRTVRLLCDPDLRRRMGEAGRRHMQANFDPTSVAKRFLALCHAPKA